MKPAVRLLFIIHVLFLSNTLLAQQALDTVVLQLKWKHQFQFAGFYAAIEKGYYKDAGIVVKVKEGNTSINFVNEVISGNADFGIESSKLVIARNNNFPVVALAAIFQHSPEIILTRKDADIRNIEDLKDKRISLGQNGLASPKALLNKFSIPEDKHIYGSSIGYVNDLIQGNTDAIATYITDAPFMLEQAGVEPLIFKPRSYGIDLYGDILFTSQQMVEEKQELTERFVKASLKGWVYAMDNKSEIIDLIINKYNSKASRELLRFESTMMEDLVMPKLIEPGHMNPERWRYIADTFVEIGQLQPLFSIDGFLLEDYQLFNNRRIKQAFYFLMVIVAVSLISLLVFFLFNRRLKKAVLQRTKELSSANNNLTKEVGRRQVVHANLTLSEERFKLLFEDSPISLWEEDFSQTKQMIDAISTKGVSDIEHYIRNHPEFVRACAGSVRINNINKATVQYMEAENKEEILNNVNEVFNEHALKDFAEELITFYNGKMLYETESEHITFKGNKLHVSITVKIPNGYEETWSKVIVSLINITDLRNTTDELKFTEVLLRQQNEALKGINEELKKSKLKAEESDRLKTAFLSNMSHEIRTPMNGIIGFTDLLKDDDINNGDKERYLSIIEENSQQLLRIISDIIDISKIEASQLKITKTHININQLFEHLLDIFKLRIIRLDKEDVHCHYNIHSQLPEELIINSDITRLRQVLTNLLENAVKFTEHGDIEFGAYPSDDKENLIFYVKDTGVGIKKERVSQIFDRFFREEERFGANLGGTGLGLSIAKNLVELLGGKIGVESTPGEGAKFYFTHPYKLP
ncbi:ABC transporter substrate-binding protein [Carboxylicivirga marina]|uniref:histidine kinase n=1 Tax=Carboxylicivirga marina TaxID=2800988 RepID=A0ABS1HQ66_9BACT|nr:ABC transporter substrate-binding protein [Carboxylicivirga marina]MBK3519816.1 ABC transporter substrate-binding protein [Carboxylicivirga marina]